MFTLIATLTLIMAITALVISETAHTKKQKHIAEILSKALFAVCIISTFTTIVVSKNITKTTTKYVVTESYNMCVLEEGNSQHDDIYLGIGEYKKDTYYKFYIETEYGREYQTLPPRLYNMYINNISAKEKPHCDILQKQKVKTAKNNDYWLVSIKELFSKNRHTTGDKISSRTIFWTDTQRRIYVADNNIDKNYKIESIR